KPNNSKIREREGIRRREIAALEEQLEQEKTEKTEVEKTTWR
ncbi:26529_t:CDS:1, partial [Racocetra persica]